MVELLWAGSGLFGALEVALDRVYRVSPRSFVRQKLMAVGLFFLLMTWAYLVAESLMVGAEMNALFRPAVSKQRQAPELAEGHDRLSKPR